MEDWEQAKAPGSFGGTDPHVESEEAAYHFGCCFADFLNSFGNSPDLSFPDLLLTVTGSHLEILSLQTIPRILRAYPFLVSLPF